jgi:hypothetical protein
MAERIHRALVDLSDFPAVFRGCNGSQQPLQGYRHDATVGLVFQGLGQPADPEKGAGRGPVAVGCGARWDGGFVG